MLDLLDHDKERIRLSWSKVMASSEIGSQLFYGRLFEAHPETRKLFKGDMISQGRKLIETLNAIVDNLDGDLSDTVMNLGARHQRYNVLAEDYDKVNVALNWMLKAMVGSDFDDATQEAWNIAYSQITATMLRGYS